MFFLASVAREFGEEVELGHWVRRIRLNQHPVAVNEDDDDGDDAFGNDNPTWMALPEREHSLSHSGTRFWRISDTSMGHFIFNKQLLFRSCILKMCTYIFLFLDGKWSSKSYVKQ